MDSAAEMRGQRAKDGEGLRELPGCNTPRNGARRRAIFLPSDETSKLFRLTIFG